MRMGSPRRVLHIFAVVWSVLQFALPMATLYADAYDAHASVGRAIAHVEDAATDGCRPAHADECALCHFLSSSSAPLVRADVSLPLARTTSSPAGAVRVACVASARGHPASRAPPTV
jgi:hypothetical protein